jgi:hypothetical protein
MSKYFTYWVIDVTLSVKNTAFATNFEHLF